MKTLVHDGFVSDEFKGITDIVKAGYGIQGMNYVCGCSESILIKDHNVVGRWSEYCKEHKKETTDQDGK